MGCGWKIGKKMTAAATYGVSVCVYRPTDRSLHCRPPEGGGSCLLNQRRRRKEPSADRFCANKWSVSVFLPFFHLFSPLLCWSCKRDPQREAGGGMGGGGEREREEWVPPAISIHWGCCRKRERRRREVLFPPPPA